MNEELRGSIRDYVRAAGGGLVVGLPLLFTMEVWWHGFALPWWKILLLLGIGFGIVVGYSSIAGFRRERTATELVLDSVVALGLGVVIAAVALVLLGQIDGSTSVREAAGKIALESIPIAFGASLAATQLGGEASDEDDGTNPLERLLVAAGGALIFALNIAPTEEPMMLGIEAPFWLLALVVAVSIVVTYAWIFFADFGGRRRTGTGILGQPVVRNGHCLRGEPLSYRLCCCGPLGDFDGAGPGPIMGMLVMLTVVAAVGAAVARLIVGGHSEAEAS